MKKLVLTKKTKEHIALKNNDFIASFTDLYESCKNEIVSQLGNEQIQKIHIKFDKVVGKVGIDTFTKDDVLTLKRRDGYNSRSLFVNRKTKKETNMLTFVISKSFNEDNVFFITTAFPSFGITIEREVGDKNIKNEEERQKCIEFWSKHAFVNTENDIGADEYEVSYSDALKFIKNGGKAELMFKSVNGSMLKSELIIK